MMDITKCKIYKDKNNTRCNICGKLFDVWDKQERFGIHSTIGYGSIHDGEVINLDMCCKCFDELMGRVQFAINPFEEDMSFEV